MKLMYITIVLHVIIHLIFYLVEKKDQGKFYHSSNSYSL